MPSRAPVAGVPPVRQSPVTWQNATRHLLEDSHVVVALDFAALRETPVLRDLRPFAEVALAGFLGARCEALDAATWAVFALDLNVDQLVLIVGGPIDERGLETCRFEVLEGNEQPTKSALVARRLGPDAVAFTTVVTGGAEALARAASGTSLQTPSFTKLRAEIPPASQGWAVGDVTPRGESLQAWIIAGDRLTVQAHFRVRTDADARRLEQTIGRVIDYAKTLAPTGADLIDSIELDVEGASVWVLLDLHRADAQRLVTLAAGAFAAME